MKHIEFSKEKNEWLQRIRGISFETLIEHLQSRDYLDDIKHPNQGRYPQQRLFLVKVKKHVYAIPYVEESEKLFLKTAYRSSKYTKIYLRKQN